MTTQEIEQLVDKYMDGTASENERLILLEWYRDNLKEEVIWLSDHEDERQRVKDRMKAKMHAGIGSHTSGKQTRIQSLPKLIRVAAAVLLLVSVSVLIAYRLNRTPKPINSLYVSHQASVDSTENRYVYLPDSSIVILRYGSSLEILSDFSKNTREVRLTGEGYFDVTKDKSRPFIVHAGDVKTVVLGTAFTVKAVEGQKDILVTVQHGRVRVEKQKKILAELVANQQLEVDEKFEVMEQKEVMASAASLWTASDLQFDGKPFGELVEGLARRYNTSISFKNPELANCPITGMFTGTETLEEVLTVLCSIRGASFKKLADGSFEIAGKGC